MVICLRYWLFFSSLFIDHRALRPQCGAYRISWLTRTFVTRISFTDSFFFLQLIWQPVDQYLWERFKKRRSIMDGGSLKLQPNFFKRCQQCVMAMKFLLGPLPWLPDHHTSPRPNRFCNLKDLWIESRSTRDLSYSLPVVLFRYSCYFQLEAGNTILPLCQYAQQGSTP